MTGLLKATDGPLKGSRFVLGERTILGRAVDCDIQVLAQGVSRQHAAIIVNDEGEPYLMDLASKNGTFVDGLPILRVRLEPGMSFRISTSEFTFETTSRLAATETDDPAAPNESAVPPSYGGDDLEEKS
ncbi:MAG TPA: FHA domain-containing protein [Polyangiaceae bacterium]